MRSGLAVAAVVLAVTGCSSNAPAPEAEPSEGPQATAPSEALATMPSIRPRTDARTLLGPDGDPVLLSGVVQGDLEQLTSVHVEELNSDGVGVTYDVDQERCSGQVVSDGTAYSFVTTTDGRLLIAQPAAPDRWVESSENFIACHQGPWGSVVGTFRGAVAGFMEPDRVGVERIDEQRTVHFRKKVPGATIDTWIAADGETTRLLKVVITKNGGQDTLRLSEFDSAGPVAPEPPADQVVGPPSA